MIVFALFCYEAAGFFFTLEARARQRQVSVGDCRCRIIYFEILSNHLYKCFYRNFVNALGAIQNGIFSFLLIRNGNKRLILVKNVQLAS